MDQEIEPLAGPIGLDAGCPARDMVAKLVDIGGNPAMGLLSAQFVRNVDVDRLLHL
jgi:hypothetical protein